MDWRAWWPIVHRSQRARHTWSNLGHMHASLPQTSLGVQTLENLLPMQKIWVWSLLQEDPWRREWLPNPVFWPGEFHGQKSLVGYSQWGHKELDMIEQLSLTSLFHHESKGLAGINAELFIHSAQCLELCRPIVSRYLMRRCRKHSMNMWIFGLQWNSTAMPALHGIACWLLEAECYRIKIKTTPPTPKNIN